MNIATTTKSLSIQLFNFSFSKALAEFLFTKQEREIYELIMKIDSRGMWFVPINDFKFAPSWGRGLDLFLSLKLQCEECPENMKALIGEELVEKLLAWTL